MNQKLLLTISTIIVLSLIPQSFADEICYDDRFCVTEMSRIIDSTEEDTINDAFFISENEGWVLTENGFIHHTTNGGDTWVNENLSTSLNSLYFDSSTSGYVVGDNGVVFSYDGIQWTDITGSFQSTDLNSVFFIEDNGWIVGSSGWIYYTNNAGESWSQKAISNYSLNSVFFTTPTDGWITTDDGDIFYTTNGVDWTSTESNVNFSIGSIFISSSNEGWAVTDPYLYYSDDGYTWFSIVHETGINFNDVSFGNTGIGLVAGDAGYVYLNNENDLFWDNYAISNEPLNSVSFVSSTLAFVTGEYGQVLKIDLDYTLPLPSADNFSITVYPQVPIIGETTTITCNDQSNESITNMATVSFLEAGDTVDSGESPLEVIFNDNDTYLIVCEFTFDGDRSIVKEDTVTPIPAPIDPYVITMSTDMPTIGQSVDIECIDNVGDARDVYLIIDEVRPNYDVTIFEETITSTKFTFDKFTLYEVNCIFGFPSNSGKNEVFKTIEVIPTHPDYIEFDFSLYAPEIIIAGEEVTLECVHATGAISTSMTISNDTYYVDEIGSIPNGFGPFTFDESGDYVISCSYLFGDFSIIEDHFKTVMPGPPFTADDFSMELNPQTPIAGNETQIFCYDDSDYAEYITVIVELDGNQEFTDEVNRVTIYTFDKGGDYRVSCTYHSEVNPDIDYTVPIDLLVTVMPPLPKADDFEMTVTTETPVSGETVHAVCDDPKGFTNNIIISLLDDSDILDTDSTSESSISMDYTFSTGEELRFVCEFVIDADSIFTDEISVATVEAPTDADFSISLNPPQPLLDEITTITCNDNYGVDAINVIVKLGEEIISEDTVIRSIDYVFDTVGDYEVSCTFTVDGDLVFKKPVSVTIEEKVITVPVLGEDYYTLLSVDRPIIDEPFTITCIEDFAELDKITITIEESDDKAELTLISEWTSTSAEYTFEKSANYNISCIFLVDGVEYPHTLHVTSGFPPILYTMDVSDVTPEVGEPVDITCIDPNDLAWNIQISMILLDADGNTDFVVKSWQSPSETITFTTNDNYRVDCIFDGHDIADNDIVSEYVNPISVDTIPDGTFTITLDPTIPILDEPVTITCSGDSLQTVIMIFDLENDLTLAMLDLNDNTFTFEYISQYEVLCKFIQSDQSTIQKSDFVTPIIFEEEPPKKKGGSSNEWKTKPTFGLSHQTWLPLVDGGFTFNNMVYEITDNWHTDFPRQNVTLGEVNTFEARVYAEKNLMVQEFLFGMPETGESHNAELGVEIWYDYDGNIEEIILSQETNVVDPDSVNVIHSMVKCQSTDDKENCHSTILSMTFLEPLQDDVMAIKAIDFKRRVNITHLNEGFNISGISLNPMVSLFITSPEKHEGLIEVTQTAKYSDLWTTQDGRDFEINEYGSHKWINQVFERYVDSGEPRTRSHSAFADLIISQQDIAQSIIDEKYDSVESVSRYDLFELMINQKVESIDHLSELTVNSDELSTICTALHMDYDAQVWLQKEYPYMIKDKKSILFVESFLDGYPLIQLKEAVNSCDNTLQALRK